MSFPGDIREAALIACARHCCLCGHFCGLKIELHHIIHRSEGGMDTFDNCIPLCFECHADMRSYDHKHPKGSKYTPNELRSRRDSWYEHVRKSPSAIVTISYSAKDVSLFNEICTILPWDGSVKFVREFNFAGWIYKSDEIDQLENFRYRCQDPSFEFLDIDLERLKIRLRDAIDEFISIEATETFNANTPGYRSVPEEWEFSQTERFHNVVGKLHATGKAIGDAYDALVRFGRRRFSTIG